MIHDRRRHFRIVPEIVAAPEATPVDLETAKKHLRVDFSDDDDLISAMIDGAVSNLDGWSGILGRCLISQTWKLDLPCWPSSLALPFPDCSEPAISYVDGSDTSQALAASSFRLVRSMPDDRIEFLGTMPALSQTAYPPVTVQFSAGYGDGPEDVPASIRAAILLMVGDLYRNRESVYSGTGVSVQIPSSATVDALLMPHRKIRV